MYATDDFKMGRLYRWSYLIHLLIQQVLRRGEVGGGRRSGQRRMKEEQDLMLPCWSLDGEAHRQRDGGNFEISEAVS